VRRGWGLRHEIAVVDRDRYQQDDWTVDHELLRTQFHRQGILTEPWLCSPLRPEAPEVAIDRKAYEATLTNLLDRYARG
jgi:hypothetical protein